MGAGRQAAKPPRPAAPDLRAVEALLADALVVVGSARLATEGVSPLFPPAHYDQMLRGVNEQVRAAQRALRRIESTIAVIVED